jgi:catechol 2,3-dioxygenase-like lactoylglutathione lyase family enzyme
MSLCHHPLVYLFLETADLAAARHTLGTAIGLPVIGVDETPGVRHGVVSYDAGVLIVSLNLASRRRAAGTGTDGLVTVFDVPRGHGAITDQDGHHYLRNEIGTGCPVPSVTQLRLATADVESSVAFYRDVLGLTPLRHDDGVGFVAGAVTLVLEYVPEPRRHDTYLLVFHTRAIEDTRAALSARGLAFLGRKVGTRAFGSTVHFDDPSGHRFCLYEPSAQALATGVGRKVCQVVAGCDGVLPIGLR